jgi:hypothetical protein
MLISPLSLISRSNGAPAAHAVPFCISGEVSGGGRGLAKILVPLHIRSFQSVLIVVDLRPLESAREVDVDGFGLGAGRARTAFLP